MTNHLSNPAGRLWEFFTSTVSGVRTPDKVRAGERWAEYFGTNEHPDPVYVDAMATLLRQPALITQMVDAAVPDGDYRAVLLRPLPTVTAVLSDIAGRNTVKTVSDRINAGVMNDLQHLSHFLASSCPKALSDNTVKNIIELADQIYGMAMDDGTLDADFKVMVIRYATRIREAASLYKVGGSQPLIDELDRFWMEAHRSGRATPAPGSGAEKVMKKVGLLTGTIATAVSLFTSAHDVGNAIEYYDGLLSAPIQIEAPAPPSDSPGA